MSGAFTARLMLSVLAAAQGLAAVAIDLNRTHATHPLWPGHARFHVVWQTLTQALTGTLAVMLIWWAGPGSGARFYLAAAITAPSMLAFAGAAVARRLYGGTFHDPGGIAPLRMHLGRRVLDVDMNAVAVGAGLAVLTAALLLFRFTA